MNLHDFSCKVGPFAMLVTMLFILWKLTTIERFTASASAVPCERGSHNCAPCGGAPEGQCIDYKSPGWENSVSTDVTAPRWLGGEPDGRCRVFKRKNYYGWNTCNSSYSYGEPFYERCVKY